MESQNIWEWTRICHEIIRCSRLSFLKLCNLSAPKYHPKSNIFRRPLHVAGLQYQTLQGDMETCLHSLMMKNFCWEIVVRSLKFLSVHSVELKFTCTQVLLVYSTTDTRNIAELYLRGESIYFCPWKYSLPIK